MAKRIADPDSLGEVAQLMRRFVGWIEENFDGGNDSDALESFDFAKFHREFPKNLADILWLETGVTLVSRAETKLTDEELKDDELIVREFHLRRSEQPSYEAQQDPERVEPKQTIETALYDIWFTLPTIKLSTANISLSVSEIVGKQLRPEHAGAGVRIVPASLRDHIFSLERWPSGRHSC